MSKKTGVFTPKQIERLPEEGYLLHLYNHSLTSRYKSTCVFCIKNGEVKGLRNDLIDNKPWGHQHTDGWSTLLWTCCPTKKQISKPTPDEQYFHFKTHKELIDAFPSLPSGFHTKAPNDF